MPEAPEAAENAEKAARWLIQKMLQRGMNTEQLAAASKIGRGTISEIRRADYRNRQALTLARISSALGEPPDSLARLFAGEEPREVRTGFAAADVEELLERLRHTRSKVVHSSEILPIDPASTDYRLWLLALEEALRFLSVESRIRVSDLAWELLREEAPAGVD